MIQPQFERSARLLGEDALLKLGGKHVAVFGVGGVGSFAIEALARTGIGTISMFDKDVIDITNCNRQLIALKSTIGQSKVGLMADRIRDINPSANVFPHSVFYSQENADEFDLSEYDYIIDAIDTVSCKLTLIVKAKSIGVPIISSMGTGNKLDPTRLEVADIYGTSVCPLAKVMRHELRKRDVDKLKVVYSREEPAGSTAPDGFLRNCPGSIAFVPPVAGFILAKEVILALLGRAS